VRKAVDLQVTVVYPARKSPLSAIVKAKADDGKTLDLALVELSEPLFEHPCVFLDEEPVAISQALYSYGYLESYTNAAPVRPVNEGLTGDTPPILKLQGAQIEKGISGAALLNLKTGRVCGMVKETRAAGFDLGGGAIPTRVILEQFPELRKLQREFHGGDRRWVNLITQPEIDFQPYLNSVVMTYEKWWQYYTLTDAEGKQSQEQESALLFDFGLMVQTVQKPVQDQPQAENPEKEKVERFSVLDGLRKYALEEKPEPVLLVGRPGSGKSTALARLMFEEAALSPSPSPKLGKGEPERIPILVELRYWQGSLSDLIHNAIARHDPTLKAVPLDRLLTNALLLFDGVNELPSDDARTELIAFQRNRPKLPMIFTTRDLSLGGDLGIERKLAMLPLTEPQMQAFIRAYIPAQAEAMLRQLKDRLREFGQTPLLLWMLCEVFQQAPNNQLPSNLGGVFQAFTQMYEASSVRKHDVALLKGDVRPLSDRRLWKKALMAIAAIMMQGKTPVDFRVAIHRDEAETELSRVFPNEPFPVRDILDDLLKYHLLQNQTTKQIEFRHQLIQEYYAAEYLLKLLPTLTDDQLKRDYLNYLKWTEPVALILALVADEELAVRVVEQALDVDLMLGSRLAGEVKPEFQEQTIGLLNHLIEQKNLPAWLRVELWGRTRSTITIEYLLKLQDQDPKLDKAIVRALKLIRNKKAIPSLIQAIQSEDLTIRKIAALAIIELCSENQGTLSLIPVLKSHQKSNICGLVVEVLGKLNSPAAIPHLIQALQKDKAPYVRASVAEALGSLDIRASRTDLCRALCQALKDEEWIVRGNAAEALGKLKYQDSIQPLLAILNDENDCVRAIVVETLGNLGDPNIAPKLLDFLQDEEWSVKWRTAEALGKLGDPAAIPALLFLLNDNKVDVTVRSSAAEALQKLGFDKITPEFLQQLQAEELAAKERIEAVMSIVNGSTISPKRATSYREIDIPKLMEELKYPIESNRRNAANKLRYQSDKLAPYLQRLQSLILTDSGQDILYVILATQRSSGFYNYEIWQAHLAAQTTDRQTHQNRDRLDPINYFPHATDVKIFENVNHYHEAPPKDPLS
jgi:HEAT repeat protein